MDAMHVVLEACWRFDSIQRFDDWTIQCVVVVVAVVVVLVVLFFFPAFAALFCEQSLQWAVTLGRKAHFCGKVEVLRCCVAHKVDE